MLKILGWVFLVGGIFLCLTIILAGFGIPMSVVGALLLIASALGEKRRRREDPGAL